MIDSKKLDGLLRLFANASYKQGLFSQFINRKIACLTLRSHISAMQLANLQRLKHYLYQAIDTAFSQSKNVNADVQFLLTSLNTVQSLCNHGCETLWAESQKNPEILSMCVPQDLPQEIIENVFLGTAHKDPKIISRKLVALWHKSMSVFDFKKHNFSTLENSYELHEQMLELILNPDSMSLIYRIQVLAAKTLSDIAIAPQAEEHFSCGGPAAGAKRMQLKKLKYRGSLNRMLPPSPPKRSYSQHTLYLRQFSLGQSLYLSFVTNEVGGVRMGYIPPVIIVFHELLHQYYFLLGHDNPRRNFLTETLETTWSNLDEWEVIDAQGDGRRLSENQLRRSLGLARRVSHQGCMVALPAEDLTDLFVARDVIDMCVYLSSSASSAKSLSPIPDSPPPSFQLDPHPTKQGSSVLNGLNRRQPESANLSPIEPSPAPPRQGEQPSLRQTYV